LGELSDGFGECSGETGPPGAKDDVNAFFEGDSGDGCPARDPGGILLVDADNCAMLLIKLSGTGVLPLKPPPPRSPFVPRGPLLTVLELNAGVEELLWKDEFISFPPRLKFLSATIKPKK